MSNIKQPKLWFVTGSQHLYGPEALRQVAVHSQEISRTLDEAHVIPSDVEFKPVVKSADEVFELFQKANQAADCIGIITWCHTFSPSKMWING